MRIFTVLQALISFSLISISHSMGTASFLNLDLSSTTLTPSTNGFTITGFAVDDQLGVSVSSAGDIDGDGYDDIIIGAYGWASSRGAAYVIYGGQTSSLSDFLLGSTTLDPHTTGFSIFGGATSDRLGFSVSSAGDINKDGFDDIIVGAFGVTSNKGAVYVIYGRERSSMTNFDFSSDTLNYLSTGFKLTGSAIGDSLGRDVSAAGDINNDGYDDIIIAAYANNNYRGAAYVIYGGEKSSLPNRDFGSFTLDPHTTGFVIKGQSDNDQVGWSVGTAGDINKDGYDDILVGANGRSSSKGTVYVIYGGAKPSMSNFDFSSVTLNYLSTGFTITGSTAYDVLGLSVSTAGDINNDGYSDFIVGGRRLSYSGIAYVIYGGEKSSLPNLDFSSDILLPATTGFTMVGAASDNLAWSISTAGDVNKDGYNDIIVGAHGRTLKGAAYVIYGGEKSSMSNFDFSSDTLNPRSMGLMITGAAASDQLGWSVSTAGDINKDGYKDLIIGAFGRSGNTGAAYVIHTGKYSQPIQHLITVACSPCWDCQTNCNQCYSSPIICTQCDSPYLLHQSQCLSNCPDTTFPSSAICEGLLF